MIEALCCSEMSATSQLLLGDNIQKKFNINDKAL
jgi:hypothetical protein